MPITPSKHAGGRPTTYKAEYAVKLINFFSGPHYTIKKEIKTAKDPLYLSNFAKRIGISLRSYRSTFKDWAERYPEFNNALKTAKELESERIRTNALLGLYTPAFSIFTMKNIAGWRDKTDIEHSGRIDLSDMQDHPILSKYMHIPIQEQPVNRVSNKELVNIDVTPCAVEVKKLT
ncbi:MAG: hypothetical protein PHQ22_10380 [Sulfuricurvum sp.]|nr:hypothetical protein [Sulfuricurvum sp.]